MGRRSRDARMSTERREAQLPRKKKKKKRGAPVFAVDLAPAPPLAPQQRDHAEGEEKANQRQAHHREQEINLHREETARGQIAVSHKPTQFLQRHATFLRAIKRPPHPLQTLSLPPPSMFLSPYRLVPAQVSVRRRVEARDADQREVDDRRQRHQRPTDVAPRHRRHKQNPERLSGTWGVGR